LLFWARSRIQLIRQTQHFFQQQKPKRKYQKRQQHQLSINREIVSPSVENMAHFAVFIEQHQ